MFQIFMDHLNPTLSALDQVQKEFEQDADKLFQKAGQTSKQDAIAHAAVRTGWMRDHVENESTFLMSETYDEVFYSYFVEKRGQPFMIPAFELARDELLQDLKSL